MIHWLKIVGVFSFGFICGYGFFAIRYWDKMISFSDNQTSKRSEQ